MQDVLVFQISNRIKASCSFRPTPGFKFEKFFERINKFLKEKKVRVSLINRVWVRVRKSLIDRVRKSLIDRVRVRKSFIDGSVSGSKKGWTRRSLVDSHTPMSQANIMVRKRKLGVRTLAKSPKQPKMETYEGITFERTSSMKAYFRD
jgi:hypothetical protein